MEFTTLKILRLGTIPHETAWQLQEQLAKEIHQGSSPPILLLLEHPHTYTIGRTGDLSNLLWSGAELKRRGIAVHPVDRGGDITYHGPGQLVGYPLIQLARDNVQSRKNHAVNRIPKTDYIGYLRILEEILIITLQHWEIIGLRNPGQTGVWVQVGGGTRAKIASIGIKVDARGVTRHGFSLNVSPDMEYWNGIIPCGLTGSVQTSLAEILSTTPEMKTVMDRLAETFACILRYRIELDIDIPIESPKSSQDDTYQNPNRS